MTKRDAPVIFLGSGFPAGSTVFLKSRFRLYSVSPIPLKLTTDRVAAREVLAAAATAYFDLALQQRVENNAFPLRFARKRLTNEITDKSADDNVFAQLGNLRIE